jgi:tRNA-dihydrouridine synthase B
MKRFGASLVCTERVDAAEVAGGDRRAMRLLYTASGEAPRAAQISGADSATMAAAARVVAEQGFDLVDLNFECPVRRLLVRGEGGALAADPPAIGRIVECVVAAVSIPVTLKIRSGPDAEQETAAEVARHAEDAGAAAVSVHARSVAQGYVGGPDWNVLARVRRAVAIPVIGSGGIRQPQDAVRMLTETGIAAVAVARGCLGNPWIFAEIRSLLAGSGAVRQPTLAQRGRALLELVEGEFRLYGSPRAVGRLPRVSGYFARWLADPPAFRQAVAEARGLPAFRRVVKEFFGRG